MCDFNKATHSVNGEAGNGAAKLGKPGGVLIALPGERSRLEKSLIYAREGHDPDANRVPGTSASAGSRSIFAKTLAENAKP